MYYITSFHKGCSQACNFSFNLSRNQSDRFVMTLHDTFLVFYNWLEITFVNDQDWPGCLIWHYTKVSLARPFSIYFITLYIKSNDGTTKLLSCLHKRENLSTALVPGHQKHELKRVNVLLLANLCIVSGY